MSAPTALQLADVPVRVCMHGVQEAALQGERPHARGGCLPKGGPCRACGLHV